MSEVHKLTMAKATEEEWQAILDFFEHLEANMFVMADYEIGEYVATKMDGTVGAGYNRVLWGFKAMVDSVCDPELPHLELKPELRNLQEALVTASDNEADAVQRAQEAERERDEYRDLYRQLDRHTHEDLVPELDWLRQRRHELERELREARAAIVELADYLKRVADYRHVDVNELEKFVAETKRIYGQEEPAA